MSIANEVCVASPGSLPISLQLLNSSSQQLKVLKGCAASSPTGATQWHLAGRSPLASDLWRAFRDASQRLPSTIACDGSRPRGGSRRTVGLLLPHWVLRRLAQGEAKAVTLRKAHGKKPKERVRSQDSRKVLVTALVVNRRG